MNCIVVYQSKTGFTKKYAEWISEELSCDIRDYKEVTKKLLSSYDVIIYGTYVRVEKIRGWNRIKDLTEGNKDKKLILFATGASPAVSEKRVESLWKASIPRKELRKIPHFYMQSGLNYEKMSLAEKLMMKGLVTVMKLKRNKTEVQQKSIEQMSHSYDNCSKEYIAPLIKHLRPLPLQ